MPGNPFHHPFRQYPRLRLIPVAKPFLGPANRRRRHVKHHGRKYHKMNRHRVTHFKHILLNPLGQYCGQAVQYLHNVSNKRLRQIPALVNLLPHHDPVHDGILRQRPTPVLHIGRQLLLSRLIRSHNGAESTPSLFKGPVQHRRVQFLLVADIIINTRLINPRHLGNPVHAGTVIPQLRKLILSRFQYFLFHIFNPAITSLTIWLNLLVKNNSHSYKGQRKFPYAFFPFNLLKIKAFSLR